MPRSGDARGLGPLTHLALIAAVAISVFLISAHAFGQTVTASRVWPADEYTRVTLEGAKPFKFQSFFVKDPERLVIDLEGLDVNDELRSLATKVREDDPYIKAMRVAVNRPGVARIVFDLKTEVKPQVFPLAPAGEYKHRLVVDIYPVKPKDPLLALLKQPDPIGEMSQPPVSGAAAPPQASATQTPMPPSIASPPVELAKVEVPELPVLKLDPRKPAPKAPKMDRLVIVAIDAGHGGEDPGARGRGGTHEKDVTLAIAKRLKAQIDKEPGMRGVLVRDGDYYIPLAQRVTKSRRVQADLFVSIHADAWVKPDARGSSVFALSERGATSAAARMLAQKENQSDTIGGVNLSVKDPVLARTLLDLSQTATINDSLKLGKAVLGEIGDINSLHKQSVEQAGFAVLKAPDIPSILVETAFISNPEEERRLKDSAYQDKLASAILGGIKRYLSNNPPLARNKVASN